MQKLNDEQTISVLTTMRMILGLCETEKEAIDNAIAIAEWKQEIKALVNELYELKKELPYKVCGILLNAANLNKYDSKYFKLGEKIVYTPTEVADILQRAIEEGDL